MTIYATPNTDRLVQQLNELRAQTPEAWVLIVEDDPAAARYLCSVVQHEGMHCVHAESVEKAIEEFNVRAADSTSATPFTLIFLDIRLGDGTGIDVLKHVKKLRPQQPVVVVSAYVDSLDIKEICKFGDVPIAHKPYSVAAATTALQTHHAAQLACA